MPTASALIRRIFDQAFNQGDLNAIDTLMAADGVTRTMSGGVTTGRAGLKQLIVTIRTAFPDVHCTVEDEIYDEDKAAAHWTMCGTHRGSFLGNRPTGRSIAAQGAIFARTKNGQIVEGWILVDQMGLLQQLGIVPPPYDVRI